MYYVRFASVSVCAPAMSAGVVFMYCYGLCPVFLLSIGHGLYPWLLYYAPSGLLLAILFC